MPIGIPSGYLEIASYGIVDTTLQVRELATFMPRIFGMHPRHSGRINAVGFQARLTEVTSGTYPRSHNFTVEVWDGSSVSNFFLNPSSTNGWRLRSTGLLEIASFACSSPGGPYVDVVVPLGTSFIWDSAGPGGQPSPQINYATGLVVKLMHNTSYAPTNSENLSIGFARSRDLIPGNVYQIADGRASTTLTQFGDGFVSLCGSQHPSPTYSDKPIGWFNYGTNTNSVLRTLLTDLCAASGQVNLRGMPFVAVGSAITRAMVPFDFDGNTPKAVRAFIAPNVTTGGVSLPEINSPIAFSRTSHASGWILQGQSGPFGPFNFFQTTDNNDGSLPVMFVFSACPVNSGSLYWLCVEANSYFQNVNLQGMAMTVINSLDPSSPCSYRMFQTAPSASMAVTTASATQIEVWYLTDALPVISTSGTAKRAFPSGLFTGRDFPTTVIREFPGD